MAGDIRTISATEFSAKCLELVDQISEGRVSPVVIAEGDRVLAILVPPPDAHAAVRGLHGFVRGSVIIPVGLDVTAPVLEEPLAAEH